MDLKVGDKIRFLDYQGIPRQGRIQNFHKCLWDVHKVDVELLEEPFLFCVYCEQIELLEQTSVWTDPWL